MPKRIVVPFLERKVTGGEGVEENGWSGGGQANGPSELKD